MKVGVKIKMLEIDADAVKRKEYDLIHYDGFIPFDLWLYLDMFERNNYLKSIGKFDSVQKQNTKVRGNMNISSNADLYLEKVLQEWVDNNPQFADIVIKI